MTCSDEFSSGTGIPAARVAPFGSGELQVYVHLTEAFCERGDDGAQVRTGNLPPPRRHRVVPLRAYPLSQLFQNPASIGPFLIRHPHPQPLFTDVPAHPRTTRHNITPASILVRHALGGQTLPVDY